MIRAWAATLGAGVSEATGAGWRRGGGAAAAIVVPIVREAQAETAAPLAITSADLSNARRDCTEAFESMIFVLRPQISVMPRQPYSRSIVNVARSWPAKWRVSAHLLPGSPSGHVVSGRHAFTIARIALQRIGLLVLFARRKIWCRAARAKR
ncbi:hypothetical protein [Sphingomonas azotifigens]|uniref:hypothetical protein n=1 Tax=Sphingomonas azotifigens TaxID=330920 RepID=UPI001FE5515B|nr:hypothetical protein [Sphingomonas azotifigens]